MLAEVRQLEALELLQAVAQRLRTARTLEEVRRVYREAAPGDDRGVADGGDRPGAPKSPGP